MCRMVWFFFHELVPCCCWLAWYARAYAMQALAGAGMSRRRSFHPQAWFKPCPISGLHLLLAQSHADGVSPCVGPRLWDSRSWGSTCRGTSNPPLCFLLSLQVARWEHKTRALSQVFGSPHAACYCLGAVILMLNCVRSHW